MRLEWTLQSAGLSRLWAWWSSEIVRSLGLVTLARRRAARSVVQLLPDGPDGLLLPATPPTTKNRPLALIPRGSVFLFETALPPMAPRERESALALEVRRSTPFRPDAIRIAYRMTSRHNGLEYFEVAALRNRAFDNGRAALEQAGLGAAEFDIASAQGAPSGMVWVGATDARSGALTPIPRALRAAALLMLVSWFSTLLILPWWERGRLEPGHRAARLLLERAEARFEQLARENEELSAAVTFKRSTPSTRRIIEDLSAVLPDDTYVVRLSLRQADLDFEGFSGDAARLVALLDRSGSFQRARFNGPIGFDGQRREDRFAMSARWAAP